MSAILYALVLKGKTGMGWETGEREGNILEMGKGKRVKGIYG